MGTTSILLGSVKFNTGDPPPVPLNEGDLHSPLLDPPPVPLLDPPPVPLKKGEARGGYAFNFTGKPEDALLLSHGGLGGIGLIRAVLGTTSPS
jgi:hypothetical protein